jgi:hypothetical protein
MSIFAWGTLAVFVGIGVLSLVTLGRSLRKPAEPDPAVYLSARSNLLFSSLVLLGSIVLVGWAITSRQYYLIFLSLLLVAYMLPVPVLFLRTRSALRRAGKLPQGW